MKKTPPTYFTKGKPIPKSMGLVTDQLKEVSELRLAMQQEVDIVKGRETELRAHLLDNLADSDDRGAVGKKYKSLITKEPVATADDWDLIHDYVYENDAFHLLGKSLNQKAVKELWDDGIKIPGIKKMQNKKLSITKVK